MQIDLTHSFSSALISFENVAHAPKLGRFNTTNYTSLCAYHITYPAACLPGYLHGAGLTFRHHTSSREHVHSMHALALLLSDGNVLLAVFTWSPLSLCVSYVGSRLVWGFERACESKPPVH